MNFEAFIGIDYSGGKTSVSRLPGIRVYRAENGELPQPVSSPASTDRRKRNWHRKEVAEWFIQLCDNDRPFVAGLDHGFSFPLSYFHKYQLQTWPEFLEDFCNFWPTTADEVTVESVRHSEKGGVNRRGENTELRLTERWTAGAKSVFLFDVQGSVAKSTHAGIPWIRRVRDRVGDKIHFWPFDGWTPEPGQNVVAEVFPSLLRRRYPVEGRSVDEQDAYAVSRWLADSHESGFLSNYFSPLLTDAQRKVAELEGWILGVI